MKEVELRPLKLEEVVPDFTLPSVQGGRVSPRDYKQRVNLVIVYLDLDRCAGCVDLLREFADNYHVYRDLETEILAIFPQSTADLRSRVGDMGLPFPLLSDENGEVARVYLGSHAGEYLVGGVFVTDRFGALRYHKVARGEEELPAQQTILDWLALIETECPECGVGEPEEWSS